MKYTYKILKEMVWWRQFLELVLVLVYLFYDYSSSFSFKDEKITNKR